MKEKDVVGATRAILEGAGYRVISEVLVPSGNHRTVILDLRGERIEGATYDGQHYSSKSEMKKLDFELLWVECKGSVNLSEALEGYIRTLFAVWNGGGLGVLAVPSDVYDALSVEQEFLVQTAKVAVGKGLMSILDVENEVWLEF